jgi:hypothetical protein
MAPDVAKVDADRDLNLGLPAWDSAMRCCAGFFMGNSLSDLEDLLIPFVGTDHNARQPRSIG